MDFQWKKIELSDKELIQGFYKREQSRSCEYTFGNNFLWQPHYPICFCVIEGMLVFFMEGENPSISFPIGGGDLKKVIELFQTYFEELGKPFQMHLVTSTQFEQLEALFPGRYTIAYDRDAADYVYESEKLITLSGKKLHGKRNHINKFKELNPDWSYEKITDENTDECVEMAKEWRILNGCEEDSEKEAEFCVTLNALKYRKELGLVGGLIRAGGRVVAFSLGEEVSQDTFVVHIEKAFADVQGAYPVINQQFVANEAAGYTYINREEDTGAEGLRKAKLSYRPVFMQEKGIVREKGAATILE